MISRVIRKNKAEESECVFMNDVLWCAVNEAMITLTRP